MRSKLANTLIGTQLSHFKITAKLGEGGIRNRDEYFLATKVAAEGADAGLQQIEQSFRKLRTHVIDLMAVHNLRDTKTQLETIRRMKGEGRIRYAGVTTSSNRQYGALEAIKREQDLDFVQLNYSIASRGAQEVLLPLARERGMAVMVNLPYGRGRTFPRVGDRPLPDWARSFAESWGTVLPQVRGLAPGGDGRDPRHHAGAPPGGQHGRQLRTASRRGHPRKDGRVLRRAASAGGPLIRRPAELTDATRPTRRPVAGA